MYVYLIPTLSKCSIFLIDSAFLKRFKYVIFVAALMVNETQTMEAIAEKSDKKLHRKLGTIDLLFLSLGGIIGSGWLFGAYKASYLAGPASILAWIIGGVIIIFIALNYSELGTMIPRSGSIVRYGQYSHGNFAGFFFGWAYFLSAVSVPAIEAEAVVTYMGDYYPQLLYKNAVMTAEGTAVATLLMVLFFFLNFFGVKVMGKVNTGMTWWKLIIPFTTVALLFAVGFQPINLSGLSYTASNAAYGTVGTTYSGFMPYGFGPVLQAVALSGIVFSFLGFRQGLDYAGEAKNPQKAIPIATVGAVIIGMVLYVLLQMVYIGGVHWATLGVASGNWHGLNKGLSLYYNSANVYIGPAGLHALASAPMAILAQSAGIVWLSYVLFGDAWISPSGTLNVYLGTSMRTVYGIGAIGYLPKKFIKVYEKTGIPILPLVASLLIGLLFFLPFPSWYQLVGFITSATVFTYLVGGPALRVLRKHAPELKRPFKLPGSFLIAPIGFVGASLVVYWSGWPLDLYLLIAVYLGFVLYFVLLALKLIDRRFDAKQLKAGIWAPIYAAVLTLLTYVGSTVVAGGKDYIPFPYDTLVVIVVAVIFYIWSVYSGIRTEEIDTIVRDNTQFITDEGPESGGL